MIYNSTKDSLPTPEPTDKVCATKYLVIVDNYAPMLAMYLVDNEGNVDWYYNYAAKIVGLVYYWADTTRTQVADGLNVMRIKDLEESLANLLGIVDTPIGRRNYGEGSFVKDAVHIAKVCLERKR